MERMSRGSSKQGNEYESRVLLTVAVLSMLDASALSTRSASTSSHSSILWTSHSRRSNISTVLGNSWSILA
jgi:hypothetical protein